MRISIKGLQEAQRANERLLAALKPSGALGRAVQIGTAAAHRYAIASTPWDTGSLRASHRIAMSDGGRRGTISIDRGAMNPWSRTRPYEYGARLHRQGFRPGVRGGIRAFYEWTVVSRGREILDTMARTIRGALP